MDKKEFVAIKEKLEAMNESFKERFSSFKTDIQSLREGESLEDNRIVSVSFH